MKTQRVFLVAMLAGLGVWSGAARPVGAQEVIDRIVAVVDKDPVFLSDVDQALAEEVYLRRLRGEALPEDSLEVDALRRQVLESLIDRSIVIAKAKQEGVAVSKTEVEDELDRWLGDLIKSAGSEAALMAELAKQGITLVEFKARYRKATEDQLLVARFMRNRFAQIEVADDEISQFFKDKYDSIPELPEVVGISHIIIFPKASPEREAEIAARVSHALKRLEGGEAFESVAADVSDDAATRKNGGVIGRVSLADLQPEIASLAAALEPGKYSQPLRTHYGFEIVKLDAKSGELYTISHILIRSIPEAAETLRAEGLADEIRSRAISGEAFEALAREHSDDAATKDDGGYLGEVQLTALDPQYAGAISALRPGQISGVLRTPQGYQILKLVTRSASRKPRLDEAKDWIRRNLEARKRESEFAVWLEQARKEIYVKRMEP